jgi:hypothetical protein
MHGNESNGFSFQNEFISKYFNEHGFLLLLVDLPSEKEKDISHKTYQI